MRIQKYYKKQSYNKITDPQLDLYMYEYISMYFDPVWWDANSLIINILWMKKLVHVKQIEHDIAMQHLASSIYQRERDHIYI